MAVCSDKNRCPQRLEVLGSSGTGVAGVCELFDVCTGNQTQVVCTGYWTRVFWKRSQCSSTLSCLSVPTYSIIYNDRRQSNQNAHLQVTGKTKCPRREGNANKTHYHLECGRLDSKTDMPVTKEQIWCDFNRVGPGHFRVRT